MKHQPNLADAAADLRRCIYASFSEAGFADPNFKTFFSHALGIIDCHRERLDDRLFEIVRRCLDQARDPLQERSKAREDLLTAASLLQNAFGEREF